MPKKKKKRKKNDRLYATESTEPFSFHGAGAFQSKLRPVYIASQLRKPGSRELKHLLIGFFPDPILICSLFLDSSVKAVWFAASPY